MTEPSPPPTPGHPERLRSLDVLRGVAVVLVLGRHMAFIDQLPATPPASLLRLWRASGWVGVDLFFVLSGFLVSGLLFREHLRRGRLDLPRFYLRRGLKIYPGFYALLALTAVAFALAGMPQRLWLRLLWDALYIQNYRMGFWAHTWSLAVEEHFYLLLGGFLALLQARRTHAGRAAFAPLMVWIPALCLAALLGRCWALESWNGRFSALAYPTHLRIDSLLWGVLLSYVYHYHRDELARRAASRWWWLAAAALVMPAFVLDLERSTFLLTWGLTFIAWGCVIIVGLALLPQRRHSAGGVSAADRLTGWIATVGLYSYSIYLWHLPIGSAMYLADQKLHASTHGPLYIAGYNVAYLVASLLGGVVMARLIEQPTLALRERLFPSLAGGLGAASAPPS